MEREILNLICQKLRKGQHYNALIDDIENALAKLKEAKDFLKALEESQYDPS